MTTPPSFDEIMAAGRAEPRAHVRVERREDIATAIVTLDDPDKLNVLSAAMTTQLIDALRDLTADDTVRTIVLTGAGRAFSTGGDLRLMRWATERIGHPEDRDGARAPHRFIRGQFGTVARLIARSDQFFIAALNGPAAGVGLAWALTCDRIVAAEDAVLVPAFGAIGLIPEVGTSYALTRALGHQKAIELYVTGEHIAAPRAHELGLVQEVVAAGELQDAALAFAARIADLPEHAVRMTKPLLRAAADSPWEQALVTEEFAEPTCFTTADFKERVGALLERRG